MNAELFIDSLKERGIELSVDKGKLKVGISQSLRATIAEHKEGLLDWLSENGTTGDNRPLGLRPENAIIPLSYSQQAMWLVEQVSDESLQYNMPMKIRLRGELHIEALEWAINELIRLQSTLRTSIEVVSGQPRQVIHHFAFEALEVVDLSEFPRDDLTQRVEKEARKELYKAFNLEHDTLIRNRLIKVGSDDYVLLQTLHHIASDGWSSSVLTQQISTLYQKYLQGDTTPLPPLPLEYADYAYWQRRYLHGKLLMPFEEFWGNHLLGAPVSHSLPLDFPRPADPTFHGAVLETKVASFRLEAFKSLCQKHNATLFMGLHAVLALMISSLGQDDDIVIGTPVANREDTRLNDIIGLFINTLPLRCQLNQQDSFIDLLSQCRSILLSAFDHQQLPFDLLLERLNIARPQNHSPLFQIMLVLQNNVAPELIFPGVEVKAEPSSAISAKYDLTLYASEYEGELNLYWEYNTALFTSESMVCFARLFEHLINESTISPTAPVKQLSLISPDIGSSENSYIEVKEQSNSDGMADLISLFDNQVQQKKDATALIFNNNSWSFSELDIRSDIFALELERRGVNPGSRVGIHTQRGPEMVVAILATLKLGATYVPLDPSYPTERLAYMVRDAGVTVIAVTPEQQTEFKTTAFFVEVDLSSPINQQTLSKPDLRSKRSAEDAITYITYTSGSTGVPKGVMGTQRGVINRLQWMWQRWPFEADEICCQKTSLNFVDHVWELFGALLHGVPLLVVDQAVVSDPSRLAKVLAEHKVTRLVLVPSLLQVLLTLPNDELLPLATIRHWTSSGETLPVSLVRQFYRVFANANLLNLYGSSEVAADISWYNTLELSNDATSVPIGYPIAQTELHVVNRNGQLLPDSCVGELYVSGAGLAAGYTAEQLTQERFVTLPDINGTLFKTGDLVRRQKNGQLLYIGRNDDQVKIRGHRIELGEVENALCMIPEIDSAIVAVREHIGQQHLAAFIVVENGSYQDTEQLHQRLLQQLPDYMVPSAINLIENIPLTTNGKLDRKALPEPQWVKAEYYEAPRNELERQLCQIWEQTLEIKRVGVFDNYYRIGGNSIHAVKLVTVINQKLGLGIQIRDIFDQKTVAGLANLQKNKNQAFSDSLTDQKSQTKTTNYHEMEL
ncbi:amino acid adenylation domain-containing protein [Photobacterium frigidiphilum]|uniref:non-ribosomal peptide synthetase n=1 Tax=Photobacterium frigidiphilum TaxID=264736 RepID=UPI003D0EB686